jgi:hypothetical protein
MSEEKGWEREQYVEIFLLLAMGKCHTFSQ